MATSPTGVLSPTSTISDFDLISASSSQSFERVAEGILSAEGDEDEIVWAVSSQSSLASTVPEATEAERTPADLGDRAHLPLDGDDYVLVRTTSQSTASDATGASDAVDSSTAGGVATPMDVLASDFSSLRLEETAAMPKPMKLWSEEVEVDGQDRQTPVPLVDGAGHRPSAGDKTSTPPVKPSSTARRRNRKRKAAAAAVVAESSYPSPAATPTPTFGRPASVATVTSPVKVRAGRKKRGGDMSKVDKGKVIADEKARKLFRGLGQRAVVDDMSDMGDIADKEKESLLSTAYDEAVKFMNSFVLNPSYYTSKASKLTFLQALILELGLCHEFALPTSLNAAKTLLKAHAFLNVRDYLAVRAEGLEALRRVMHPSRRALVKDLGRKKRAPVRWVKETGLTVLLVSCYR